jgi:hypothetical protein
MSHRKKKLAEAILIFMRQYGQKRRPGWLNDRHYSRQIEGIAPRMDPVELDALLRDEGEDQHETDEGERSGDGSS